MEFMKTMMNSVEYSNGFIQGIELSRLTFNQELGLFIKEALGKYIDAKARSNPQNLHHVYEWNQTGSLNARLFKFEVEATPTIIKFLGSFLPSSSISSTSKTPFVDKAEIMENGIEITIAPKSSEVLVFESDGETIFTKKTINISNPGGIEVVGSFAETVNNFFNNYLTTGLLKSSGILQKLENPKEYYQYFSEGAKGGGASTGKKAGRKYLTIGGIEIQ